MKGILFKPWKILYIAEHPNLELQTRRVIKLSSYSLDVWEHCIPHNGEAARYFGEPYLKVQYDPITDNAGTRIFPRYQQGETVYIKETYWVDYLYPDNPSVETRFIHYKLGHDTSPAARMAADDISRLGLWQTPLFMPEWAARYFITITDVRAERLQEISRDDILAEGIYPLPYHSRVEFINLWNSINKDYPFESNPWVWVYTFRRAE